MQTLTKRPHPAGVATGANSRPNHATYDPLTEVTSRLKGVIKRHNGGLMAFCPSHDDCKGRSLAVTLGRQGQVFMYCFAGCSIHEITSAIDLNASDLFIRSDSKYEPQLRAYFNDWQVLGALRHDALIVLIAARTMLAGKTLPEADAATLSGAVIRIHEAVNFSRGACHE